MLELPRGYIDPRKPLALRIVLGALPRPNRLLVQALWGAMTCRQLRKAYIVFADDTRVGELQRHVDRVLQALGVEAMVTDESNLRDFAPTWPPDETWAKRLDDAALSLGVPVHPGDTVVAVAERLALITP